MRHVLVVPDDLIEKLHKAEDDTAILARWEQIGVGSAEEMMDQIICRLNEKFAKLNLAGYRRERKDVIKKNLNNGGNVSKYSGYFENEDGGIDGLFFYNEPNTDNANDIATRNIWAALIGIYGAMSEQMTDLHFVSRPVYIVNLNETRRLSQRNVKINIICAALMGFHYLDLFDNDLTDVISEAFSEDPHINYADGSPDSMITTLEQFEYLISGEQTNDFFEVDDAAKTFTVLSDRLLRSSNPAAELYRLCSRIVPAVSFAKNENYRIDMQNLEAINNTNVTVLKTYLRKLQEPYRGNHEMQVIYYGAPGTGKSHTIDTEIIRKAHTDYVFRVTFYPDYTYNDFVGQLLPKVIPAADPKDPGTITYDFVKGVFTKALEKAYEDTSKDVYLIIEEMSRGDCAAVFGDIFQLLDREKEGLYAGYSKYFINNDMIAKDIVALPGTQVKLPPKFHILGTVNTSDQNVFVMDTAFKRRFEWEYVSPAPIETGRPFGTPEHYKNNPQLEINNGTAVQQVTWVTLYQALNRFIADDAYLGLGEDKQIGPFFIEFDLSDHAALQRKKQIKNKLLHYLWSDVHHAAYKSSVTLFDRTIGTFSELYKKYEADEKIFSDQFLSIL